MDLPTNARGIYAVAAVLVALLLAVFASTLLGALLVIALVVVAAYGLYVVFYRTDRYVRKGGSY